MNETDRINQIYGHPLYRECLEKIREAEADRCFCHHSIEHFLDVARIAYIMNLEERTGIERELIYAAALLHDIGKFEQYWEGTPHEIASARYAPEIMEDCNFSKDEIQVITEAILSHRDKGVAGKKNLQGLLYRADKASRSCFGCPVQEECNWSDEKKNLKVTY